MVRGLPYSYERKRANGGVLLRLLEVFVWGKENSDLVYCGWVSADVMTVQRVEVGLIVARKVGQWTSVMLNWLFK